MGFTETQQAVGVVGIAGFMLTALSIPLYFVYSGPPPAKNVLWRVLISLFSNALLLLWAAGFYYLVTQTNGSYGWLALSSFAVLIINVGLYFVAAALEAGSVLGKKTRFDPTLIGSGAEGFIILTGPISRLFEGMFLFLAAYLAHQTEVLPDWMAWLAAIIGILQFLLIFTIFSTTKPEKPLSVNGWNIPIAGGLYFLWIFIASVHFVL